MKPCSVCEKPAQTEYDGFPLCFDCLELEEDYADGEYYETEVTFLDSFRNRFVVLNNCH